MPVYLPTVGDCVCAVAVKVNAKTTRKIVIVFVKVIFFILLFLVRCQNLSSQTCLSQLLKQFGFRRQSATGDLVSAFWFVGVNQLISSPVAVLIE